MKTLASLECVQDLSILMVDDMPSNLFALSQVMEEYGANVFIAKTGEQALHLARIERPALVLLDVMMPGMNGFEVCRRMKADPVLRDIPVIFMTGLTDYGNRIRGFEAGAVDYVTKPFEIGEVLARVTTHISLRQMQQRLVEQNAELQKEITLRKEIEVHLQQARDLLEERVVQRTAQLAHANLQLSEEIGERVRTEELLRRNEARVRRLVESNIIGIYFWDTGGTITDANDAFLRLLGYTRQDLERGKVRLDRISAPEYSEANQHALEELQRTGTCTPFEKEYIRKDGRRVPTLIGGAFLNHEQHEGVAFVLDLSRHKRAEERIRYMADHDALTALPNRTLLRDRLQQALAQAHRARSRVAVLFIDLDYFKHINDSLGHQVGDCLLKMAAGRLQHCVREGDTVARHGGDEFVLILPLVNDGADAALVASKAIEALDAPFYCEDHEMHVSCSIGISLYPDDGKDVDTLMRTADTAMYHAKEQGRGNYQFFTPEMNKAAQRRHLMSNALRHALMRDELVLYFQPQVDLESGKIFAAEALLRWKRNNGTPAVCTEFITIAEETGLILPIGEWVLREACKQLKRWHDLGHKDLAIAVNLSPRQFFQPNFLNMVRSIVDDSGIPPNRLDLEITESMLLDRSEDNITTLKQLSAMGIKLSVDDFGTGYSSLAYLQRFPVDALKIDRSFIRGVGESNSDTALVTAIISMAHSLRLNVLAEGVETLDQIRFLHSHGCLLAQGYYYSEPVSAEVFTRLLQDQSRSAVNV